MYPWLWAHGVFEDFLTVRRRAAHDEMKARGLSYDDVVELVQSQPEAWREYKQAVKRREKHMG